jgi:hypothetical protein
MKKGSGPFSRFARNEAFDMNREKGPDPFFRRIA